MRVVRIYTGDDQQSHFEDIELTIGQGEAGSTRRSPFYPATGAGLRESGGTRVMDFHQAPRRQFVVTLLGRVEIETGDGSKRELGPGDVLLADDTTGQGHILRDLGEPHRSFVVPLGPDFDLEAFRRGA